MNNEIDNRNLVAFLAKVTQAAKDDLFAQTKIMEIRAQSLEALYQYMFTELKLSTDLCLAHVPIFETLCPKIDALLGKNRQGFHWESLHREPMALSWYWRLNDQMDAAVGMMETNHCVTFVLAESRADAERKLRNEIGELVKTAIQDAIASDMNDPFRSEPFCR
jgi:hypothetical protein